MSSRQIGRQQFLRPSGRAPHLVGQCPIGERFGEMDAADFVGAIEIGECTGYAQHAVALPPFQTYARVAPAPISLKIACD
jgi:hypothetical protein